MLIARLSTADGARSPLGHIANEVFSDLARELESQGLSKKVVADMFGMALRSYRQKVQRLEESASSRGVTLRSAVQSYLAEREWSTRSEILERFKYDDETSLRGILNDLVENGFVICSGSREDRRYRAATEEELQDLGARWADEHDDFLSSLVWLHVYREGPLTLQQLAKDIPFPRHRLSVAVAALVAEGRVDRQTHDGVDVFDAKQFSLPVGEAAAWEAVIVDHHRAVLNAIADKVTSGSRNATSDDEVGVATLTFDLWPGHPKERDVRRLLATTRAAMNDLWEKVHELNEGHERSGAYQVHFYFGQSVVVDDDLP